MPVIEGDYGQERFLTRNPIEVFSNPINITKVQLLTGITEHEMFYIVERKWTIRPCNCYADSCYPFPFLYPFQPS
jgi:hypothetical protein